MHDVFISYCQPDRNFAAFLHDALTKENFSVWMAGSGNNGVQAGNPYKEAIVHAITKCQVFILIYSIHVNGSRDVKNELALAEKKKIIPVRRDFSEMDPELYYDLKRLEYIDATGSDNSLLLHRLIRELNKTLNSTSGDEALSTDKMLFRKGLSLLRARHFAEARTLLQHYKEIEPVDPEAGFYLALSMVAGKRSTRLDGTLINKLEDMLLPFAETNQHPKINYLLALIKYGYYTMNHFRETKPMVEELIRNQPLSRKDAAEILFFLQEPDNPIWKKLNEI